LAKKLIDILDEYGLKNKIITYIKDNGSNLNSMISVLKFVMKCQVLGLEETFKEHVLGMFSSMFVNVPLMTRKFISAK
jgi:hypothetical protein